MGNLIRPPFCLFPAQTRQPPFFDLALPEGQPNKKAVPAIAKLKQDNTQIALRNNYIIFCKKYVVKFLKKKFKNCINYLRKQENNVLKENFIIITFYLIDLEAVSNLLWQIYPAFLLWNDKSSMLEIE